mmetsp:Transcript_13157/g.28450  ORF Transcript_13157/g.28450 Transcript_13157/m.28450 type:complete len:278 (+) Transcript_13157:3557-4390(+)
MVLPCAIRQQPVSPRAINTLQMIAVRLQTFALGNSILPSLAQDEDRGGSTAQLHLELVGVGPLRPCRDDNLQVVALNLVGSSLAMTDPKATVGALEDLVVPRSLSGALRVAQHRTLERILRKLLSNFRKDVREVLRAQLLLAMEITALSEDSAIGRIVLLAELEVGEFDLANLGLLTAELGGADRRQHGCADNRHRHRIPRQVRQLNLCLWPKCKPRERDTLQQQLFKPHHRPPPVWHEQLSPRCDTATDPHCRRPHTRAMHILAQVPGKAVMQRIP